MEILQGDKDSVGVVLDHTTKKKYMFKKEMLLNTIGRDGSRVVSENLKSDNTFFLRISEIHTCSQLLLFVATMNDSLKANRQYTTCLALLFNAGQTIETVSLLLAHGYRLQPMNLLRNIIENVAVVAHLLQNPGDCDRYLSDDLSSTKTIGSLKKLVPAVGQLYGTYSDLFVHISSAYNEVVFDRKSNVEDASYKTCRTGLYIGCWIHNVIVELVSLMFGSTERVKYWSKKENGEFLFIVPNSFQEDIDAFHI